MTRTPPTRYKEQADLSPDEHLTYMRTGELPESEQYREYKHDVLERAGITDDDGGSAPAVEDMTPADHFASIRRTA